MKKMQGHLRVRGDHPSKWCHVWPAEKRNMADGSLRFSQAMVNWSAVGPVSPEEARRFARELERCANRAEANHAKFIARHPNYEVQR